MKTYFLSIFLFFIVGTFSFAQEIDTFSFTTEKIISLQDSQTDATSHPKNTTVVVNYTTQMITINTDEKLYKFIQHTDNGQGIITMKAIEANGQPYQIIMNKSTYKMTITDEQETYQVQLY